MIRIGDRVVDGTVEQSAGGPDLLPYEDFS